MICKLLKDIYDNSVHNILSNGELLEQPYIIQQQLTSIFDSIGEIKTFERYKSSVFYFKDNMVIFEICDIGKTKFVTVCENFNQLFNFNYDKILTGNKSQSILFDLTITNYLKSDVIIRSLIENQFTREKWESIAQVATEQYSEIQKEYYNLWNECNEIGYYSNKTYHNGNGQKYYIKNGVIYFSLAINNEGVMIISLFNTPHKKLSDMFGLNQNELSIVLNQIFSKKEYPNIINDSWSIGNLYNANRFKTLIGTNLSDSKINFQNTKFEKYNNQVAIK